MDGGSRKVTKGHERLNRKQGSGGLGCRVMRRASCGASTPRHFSCGRVGRGGNECLPSCFHISSFYSSLTHFLFSSPLPPPPPSLTCTFLFSLPMSSLLAWRNVYSFCFHISRSLFWSGHYKGYIRLIFVIIFHVNIVRYFVLKSVIANFVDFMPE